MHENEEIESRVAESLHETGAHSLAGFGADGIPDHTIMSELSLLRREPASGKRLVWENEDADNCDAWLGSVVAGEVEKW